MTSPARNFAQSWVISACERCGDSGAPPFSLTDPFYTRSGPATPAFLTVALLVRNECGFRYTGGMPGTPHASRRVLVVGATGRLGVAISEALDARGDEVILTGRDTDKLDRLSTSLAKGPQRPPF